MAKQKYIKVPPEEKARQCNRLAKTAKQMGYDVWACIEEGYTYGIYIKLKGTDDPVAYLSPDTFQAEGDECCDTGFGDIGVPEGGNFINIGDGSGCCGLVKAYSEQRLRYLVEVAHSYALEEEGRGCCCSTRIVRCGKIIDEWYGTVLGEVVKWTMPNEKTEQQ